MPRRAIRHLLLVAGLAASVLATTSPAPVAAAETGGQAFVTAASTYRVNRGLPPVAFNALIDQVTAERTAQLVAADTLGHDMDYVMRRFSELGVCWTRVGEIVAFNWSGQVSDFITQWHNSDGHRAVMQRASFNVAGGRMMQGRDGRWYAAMIFVEYCGTSSSTAPTTTGGFTDVGGSGFRAEIGWLSAEGITGGCTASRFCPTAVVTREQMASFLTRSTAMPRPSRDWFRDDGASMHEGSINQIATASVAAGCTSVKYCPASRVTREQMASFLVRALNLPAAKRDWFRDDEASIHEAAINSLAEAGITGGCASGRYCPGGAVTREQMAGFLYRAFGP